jgi:hypothetical protein
MLLYTSQANSVSIMPVSRTGTGAGSLTSEALDVQSHSRGGETQCQGTRYSWQKGHICDFKNSVFMLTSQWITVYQQLFSIICCCGSLPQHNKHYQIGAHNVSPDTHWIARRLASAGSKHIKTWLPSTKVTVAITPTARQQHTYLPSDHRPASSQSTCPANTESTASPGQ